MFHPNSNQHTSGKQRFNRCAWNGCKRMLQNKLGKESRAVMNMPHVLVSRLLPKISHRELNPGPCLERATSLPLDYTRTSARNGDWTRDYRVKSSMLYQLSYSRYVLGGRRRDCQLWSGGPTTVVGCQKQKTETETETENITPAF